MEKQLILNIDDDPELRKELIDVIEKQKAHLNTADIKQLSEYYETIDKAMDLDGRALEELPEIDSMYLPITIQINNPLRPLINQAMELQNEILKNIEKRYYSR